VEWGRWRIEDESSGSGKKLMAVLRNSKHERFCHFVARGENATSSYISAGYSENGARGAACKLQAHASIAERITELQAAISKSLVVQAITIKEARLRAVNDRWLKLQQVIAERASDPNMQEIPGGKTGLLAHDQKGVGAGAAAEVIDVYEVDTGLLKELREHEVQAAKELGQWSEKAEITGPDGGPIETKQHGIDLEEFGRAFEAFARRSGKEDPARNSDPQPVDSGGGQGSGIPEHEAGNLPGASGS